MAASIESPAGAAQSPGPAERLGIIASHGTLDAAYMPLILATTAPALGMDAAIFFTFYGLEIIKKDRIDHLMVSPVANPAMPVHVPNVIGVMPGMTRLATHMMHEWIEKAGIATIPDLIDLALESEVRLIACQMTMDMMGVDRDELIDGVEIGGAATYLGYISDNAVTVAF